MTKISLGFLLHSIVLQTTEISAEHAEIRAEVPVYKIKANDASILATMRSVNVAELLAKSELAELHAELALMKANLVRKEEKIILIFDDLNKLRLSLAQHCSSEHTEISAEHAEN